MKKGPQIKLHVLSARHAHCSACPHVVRHPAWPTRKMWCGKLFNGDLRHRHQPAYLPSLTANAAAACPVGKFNACGPDDIAGLGDPVYRPELHAVFHALWAEIHAPECEWSPRFVKSIALRVPCGDCRRHFLEYVKQNPPPYGHKGVAAFAYGVELHNAVNARLGKPTMTLEEARAKWF